MKYLFIVCFCFLVNFSYADDSGLFLKLSDADDINDINDVKKMESLQYKQHLMRKKCHEEAKSKEGTPMSGAQVLENCYCTNIKATKNYYEAASKISSRHPEWRGKIVDYTSKTGKNYGAEYIDMNGFKYWENECKKGPILIKTPANIAVIKEVSMLIDDLNNKVLSCDGTKFECICGNIDISRSLTKYISDILLRAPKWKNREIYYKNSRGENVALYMLDMTKATKDLESFCKGGNKH